MRRHSLLPMFRRWFGAPRDVGPYAARPANAAPPTFSLRRLARENPALADSFLWGVNPSPTLPEPWWLHLGCGERVLDGFVNVDFIPHDENVLAWQLLDLWPEALAGRVEGVFSEDVLEHFFRAEQIYILCNVNRALAPDGVARTLMPNLARLVDHRAGFRPGPDDFLHRTFGVQTGGDALNLGMRFSGHRWLHDTESLRRMAALCGFDVVPTACATSTVSKFDGINLRDEANSLSFANDLRKVRPVERVLVSPKAITGARHIEEVGDGIELFVATTARPRIEYCLPRPVDARAVACINVRSSNLSSFAEHNQKTLVVDDVNCERPWYFDETLKSRACMNIIEGDALGVFLGERPAGCTRLSFSPAARAGEYFTGGCAEVYWRE